MNSLNRGLWAGIFASSVMSIFVMKYFEWLPKFEQSPLPPAKLTDDIETTVAPRSENPELRSFNSLVSHFAYGIAAAELYSHLAPSLKAPPAIKGIGFATALWAGSYLGWIPFVGYRPSAFRLTLDRNVMMVAAHVIWGLTAAVSDDALARRGNDMWDGKPQ